MKSLAYLLRCVGLVLGAGLADILAVGQPEEGGAWPARDGEAAATNPAALEVGGLRFAIKPLQSGGQAFQNRKYAWAKLPPEFAGWQYTQLAGGDEAAVVVRALSPGWLYAAGGALTNAAGWELAPGAGLAYTDAASTVLPVWRRPIAAGSVLALPQGGWAGTLVLAPNLKPRATNSFFDVPGVVISYSPSRTRQYIGCPSIAILTNGAYVTAHSYFGKGSTDNRTRIFRSADRGRTWEYLVELQGQWWSTLFVHEGRLYIMGTSGRPDFLAVIRRSDDGGRTWTAPRDAQSGLLRADSGYHCAPVPVLAHQGRVWRAMEKMGEGWRAFMMSAPAGSDLLQATNWLDSSVLRCTNAIPECPSWREGNAVAAPDGSVVNVIRLEYPGGDKAAILQVSADGRELSFDRQKDLVAMPGAHHKFTIRRDPVSARYWSLVNLLTKPDGSGESDKIWYYRNVLALVSSPDLRAWRQEGVLLGNNAGRVLTRENNKVGFQYVDWQFDGADLVAVSRTAWGDEVPRSHDANYLTFHRVRDFRTKPVCE